MAALQNRMEAAMLAPTAMNQQKFLIRWDGSRQNGSGFFAKVDLGIPFVRFPVGSLAFRDPQPPDPWDGFPSKR